MEIEICKWDKYNTRKDIKNPSWFALSNRMVEDSDIYELSDKEFRAWIYCLSRASVENDDGRTEIDFRHSLRVCGINKEHIVSMLEKMEKHGAVRIRTQSERVRTDGVQAHQSHVPYITNITDITEQGPYGSETDYTHPLDLKPEEKVTPQKIMELWNDKCEELGMPKVLKLNEQRKKKLGNFLNDVRDLEDWQRIFLQASNKSFVGHDGRKFTPSFDYVLEKGRHISLLEEAKMQPGKKSLSEYSEDEALNYFETKFAEVSNV